MAGDKLLEVEGVRALCGEFLCEELATHTCKVIGGPVLQFCRTHAGKMAEAALEAGVSSRIELCEKETGR
jgi:hypothetical protein